MIPQPVGIIYSSANTFFFSSGEHLTNFEKIKKPIEVARDVMDTSGNLFRKLNLMTGNNSRGDQCVTNEDETIMEVGGGDVMIHKRKTQKLGVKLSRGSYNVDIELSSQASYH